MKIYFAGADNGYETIKTAHQSIGVLPRLLVSYYMLKGKVDRLTNMEYSDLFLDSGAFSAWTQDKRIEIKKYIDYIKAIEGRLTLYANLDVIGDFEASMRNQKFMELHGLKPLPVFHMSAPQEPFESLDNLCKEYEYIALGGLAGKNFSSTQKETHLDKSWTVISKHFKAGRKIRIHGFGVTQLHFLQKYPFYSVDSTTWLNGTKFGEIQSSENGTIMKVRSLRIEANAKTPKVKSIFALADDKTKLHHNVIAFRKHEEYLTKLWEARGITWN